MLKKILAVLGIILAIFIVIAALKPADYLIKRDIIINAKAEVIGITPNQSVKTKIS